MRFVVLDFETRSPAPLGGPDGVGAWAYAEHPDTEIIFAGYQTPRMERAKVPCLLPHRTERIEPLRRCAENPDVYFVAHNANFEQAIWHRVLVDRWEFPTVPEERWIDTMAICAHYGLPLGLDGALEAVGLGNKDLEGNKVLQKVTKPRKLRKAEKKLLEAVGEPEPRLMYEEDPETIERTRTYCQSDVEQEFALYRLLGDLPAIEWPVYVTDQRVNNRGLKIDTRAVEAGIDLAEREQNRLTHDLKRITGGKVETADQRDRLLKWLGNEAPADLRAETVTEALGRPEAFSEDAYVVLHIRQLLSKSSTKKLYKMRDMASRYDGRARGLLQYQGATATGRWSGRGVQPQNMPGQPGGKDPDELVEAVRQQDTLTLRDMEGGMFGALSGALRPMFMAAPGHEFRSADYNAIEARIVLALAGQWDKVELLAGGHDAYADMAETIFGHPKGTVTKATHPKHRQVGKNAVLGLGFQCGPPTFQAKFQPDADLDFCETVVQTYRRNWAPNVPRLWRDLEDSCAEALYRKRESRARCGVTYRLREGVAGGPWLEAELPSGRSLWYHHPRVKLEDGVLVMSYMGVKEKGQRRVKINLYGGLLTENVVQGLARDLMADAFVRAEREGMRPVLTVHDELLTEPEADHPRSIESLMEEVPQWAQELGIPVAVEGWTGGRFRK